MSGENEEVAALKQQDDLPVGEAMVSEQNTNTAASWVIDVKL